MTLKEYLETRNATEFAAQIGVSKTYVSFLRNGVKQPTQKMRFAIHEATGGEVPVDGWPE
jgi:DNA-binding transcriptional regulator YdaS (Cro superfamily)